MMKLSIIAISRFCLHNWPELWMSCQQINLKQYLLIGTDLTSMNQCH